jgi:hypothetical protein
VLARRLTSCRALLILYGMFGLVLGGSTLSRFETEERFGGYPGLRIEKFFDSTSTVFDRRGE